MTLRPPTMAELAVMIRQEHDEHRRTQLLDWYWAKAIDEHGALLAHWHRQEYDWLLAERPRRTGQQWPSAEAQPVEAA